jgi:hypothetical protein
LFEQLHDQIREELAGLDDAALNWSPGPDGNSIATIVTHVVGSEAETLRCVANVPCSRNREAEFVPDARSVAEVLSELDGADALIAALRPAIDAKRLRATVGLPTLPAHERRTGLTWLVGNYGHGREHVGHIQMTRQLYHSVTNQSVAE